MNTEVDEWVHVFVCVCVLVMSLTDTCMQANKCVCARVRAFSWQIQSCFIQPVLSINESIQCFVHHVSSLSTFNGNVPCDTVHLIKVVCLTVAGVPGGVWLIGTRCIYYNDAANISCDSFNLTWGKRCMRTGLGLQEKKLHPDRIILHVSKMKVKFKFSD